MEEKRIQPKSNETKITAGILTEGKLTVRVDLYLLQNQLHIIISSCVFVTNLVTNEKISLGFFFRILYTLLIPFGKFVFVTQCNCVATEQRH